MTGIGRGHEKGDQTGQSDGLADGDVLSSPTLTNFNERGLMNGVVPTNLNNYNNSTRNTTNSGDCVCSSTGTPAQSIVIAVGTILVDGVFYEIAAQNHNILTTTAKYATYNTAAPTIASSNHERILLVYFDPMITGYIGFVYGTELDTSSGTYPTSPDAHLVKQTIVLASVRLGKDGNNVIIKSVEDRRVFIRPGPFPVSSLINGAGAATMPTNTFVSGNAGTAPVPGLGFIFARDPAGLGSYPDGSGGTHLFYQSDLLIDQSGTGGAYQITPTHRTSIKTATYTGSPVNVTLLYSPLGSQDENATKLVDVLLYRDNATPRSIATLVQGLDYTISANVVTINGSLGFTPTPTDVKITYVHAGHTG